MDGHVMLRLGKDCKSEGYEGEFSFAGFGEPTLHPDLPSLIRILREHCSKNFVVVITNGDFLVTETAQDLISAGVNKIVVSCYDGPEKRDAFVQMLSKLPVEYEVKSLWLDQNTTLERVVKSNNFNNRTGAVNIGHPHDGLCYYPFYKLIMDWNGDTLLCAQDWLRKQKDLGNILQTTLRQIWFNVNRTEVRKRLTGGYRTGACEGCNACGTMMGQESFDLLNPYL